ncbi:hypothetical protein QJS10_CPB14g01005 [Acorus calamus]|uniref:Uncharacterized protein n=1 Tax=Acorus calamus TaxID=4465 RepID=A0AAV9DE17_ACOCL|nr:hypothetical protein QJS10_CPB14g01005 [Acorus calamus]
MRRALQRYSHILSADDRYICWQEVEDDCKEDPEGLALRLAVSAALEVAESSALSLDLRRELQRRQLVKLLTADPLNGGDLRKPHILKEFPSLRDNNLILTYSAKAIAVKGQERLPSVSIAEGWVLSGDSIKDDAVRLSHRYESSPDVILFKALLSLCSDELISAKGAIDLCVAQMKNVLSAQQLPLHASMEILGRAYYATETFVQAKWAPLSPPSKMSGENWVANGEESRRFGHRNLHCKVKERMEAEVGKAMEWLGGLLVDVGGAHRVEDVLGGFTLMIDSFPLWNAWGHALIRVEHYAQPRVKFKQAFQLYKGDPTPVILEIINEFEGSPPVDVSVVPSMYEHLAKSAPTILDDSLSADSHLNVLYMPSTFPHSERSRQSQEVSNPQYSSNSEFDDGPRSNLDNMRYIECFNYFQEYARQLMLGFMFRHGHYNDACMLFFPPDGIPPQPLSLPLASPSSSTQRMDPLATDYGTIDELCDLCVGYGAMGILEDIISARVSMIASQDSAVSQYTASALARICLYCETHHLFNFLYRSDWVWWNFGKPPAIQ